MYRYSLFTVMCVIIFSSTVIADEVRLANGDIITGKIVKLTDGNLVIQSEQAGEITIPQANITTFSSDEPITINLTDGTSFNRIANTSTSGNFLIVGTGALNALQFSVADIESFSASVRLSKRTEKDRATFGADYAKSRQRDPVTTVTSTSEDWWRLKGKYDYFFSKKMYGYADGRYETDAVALLDRRVVVGGGLGYQYFENNLHNLSLELGLASLYEKYTNVTASNSELSIQAGYSYSRNITDKIKFIHDLTFYPSLNSFNNYYLTTTAEIKAKLTSRIFANFMVIFNYDATPAPGKGDTDVKYLLGIGVEF
jgi:hypothetical protein